MSVLSAANGRFRLWETCNAAMNCPWFLKPIDAWFNVMPAGSSAAKLALSCGCDEIFAAIGFSLVVVDALGCVVDVVDVVDGVTADFGDPEFADAWVDGLAATVAVGGATCTVGACEAANAGEQARHVIAVNEGIVPQHRIALPPGGPDRKPDAIAMTKEPKRNELES
jgi:hypothetical protein